MRTALLPYTVQSGAVGGALLDAEEDRLSEAPFLCFEMSHLMELGPKYVVPTLLYLFHRIYQRLDGSPTLLVLDEAWTYLRDPLFAGQLRQWLKELRAGQHERSVCHAVAGGSGGVKPPGGAL